MIDLAGTIIAGGGEVTIKRESDSKVYYLGFGENIKIRKNPLSNTNLAGQIRVYGEKNIIEAEFPRAGQDVINSLGELAGNKATIYIAGFNSYFEASGLYVSYSVDRGYVDKPHSVKIRATVNSSDGIKIYENLHEAYGSMENDGGGGVAETWIANNWNSTSLVTSFLTDGGKCQQLEWNDVNTGMQFRRLLTDIYFKRARISFAGYFKNAGAADITVSISVNFYDVDNNFMFNKKKTETIQAGQWKRISHSVLVYGNSGELFKKLTQLITVPDGTTGTLQVDNVQLQFGTLTNYKEA